MSFKALQYLDTIGVVYYPQIFDFIGLGCLLRQKDHRKRNLRQEEWVTLCFAPLRPFFMTKICLHMVLLLPRILVSFIKTYLNYLNDPFYLISLGLGDELIF